MYETNNVDAHPQKHTLKPITVANKFSNLCVSWKGGASLNLFLQKKKATIGW
jgi:hypothetical protein